MVDDAVNLIEYEDLERCEMCEDWLCIKCRIHFYDCDCQLAVWYEEYQKLEAN